MGGNGSVGVLFGVLAAWIRISCIAMLLSQWPVYQREPASASGPGEEKSETQFESEKRPSLDSHNGETVHGSAGKISAVWRSLRTHWPSPRFSVPVQNGYTSLVWRLRRLDCGIVHFDAIVPVGGASARADVDLWSCHEEDKVEAEAEIRPPARRR